MTRERFRVLLIEDNPGDALLLREHMRDAQDVLVDLSHADTLREGLERAQNDSFDILMLDLSLPDEEGLDTVVRAHALVPKVPIIVLTGRDDAQLAAKAVREGAQDYLVKGQVNSYLIVRAMRYATERKRATDQLRASESYFRSLIENATDIITVIDSQGRITYDSPSMGRLCGAEPSSFTGRYLVELVHPEDRGLIQEMLRIGWTQSVPTAPFEFRVCHRDQKWRVLEGIGHRQSLGGDEGGLVLNSRDITERKLAEEKLREVNETLTAVIETSPLAILSVDLDFKIREWNRAAAQLFLVPTSEALGKMLDEVAPDCAAYVRSRRERRLTSSQQGEETTFQRSDGSFVDVSVWQTRLRAPDGHSKGYLLVAADITDRRRLEEQFRQSQKMEAVGRLAGGVAHDFNNLLTVVSGYTELLLDRLNEADPMAEDLRQVLRAAERGSSLTRQLLAFSRQQIVQPVVIDLHNHFREMAPMLRRFLRENVELVISVPPETGKVRIDPGQLEQVVVNLVVNARDALPQGGKLTIETLNVDVDTEYARLHTGLEIGPYVLLAVSDNGVGMTQQTISHLFEPFFTTKERGRGTGLGLSTSYGIVKQNRGVISVYSELGRGSVFKIFLPEVDAPTERDSPAAKEPGAHRGEEKILVVEDEEDVRRVVREMLEQQGYSVVTASSGSEALALCSASTDIDLLITDVVMPGMSGRELADQLSACIPDLNVLFVSGYTDTAIVHHGVLNAGVHFLQKPFTPNQLARKVRELLDA
jgi:two-component system, cell cycle sensor histidine kinase and response regulator CckA